MDEEQEICDDKKEGVLKTDVSGFDELFAGGGIPKGNSVLIAGGPGTGKSILCRQICFNLVSKGKKCMYVSFEESQERIAKSMENFGWDVRKFIENGDLLIQKINPLDILRMKFGSIGGSGSAAELSYKIKPPAKIENTAVPAKKALLIIFFQSITLFPHIYFIHILSIFPPTFYIK